VPVERLRRTQLGAAAASAEILVVDAPHDGEEGWSADAPVLTIVPTRERAEDLEHTLEYLHSLAAKGRRSPQVAIVLCRIHSAHESALARGRLTSAGHVVLEGELRQSNSFPALQETGRAVTESPVAALAQESYELVKAMQGAFVTAGQLGGS
jgi:hypothetical protein